MPVRERLLDLKRLAEFDERGSLEQFAQPFNDSVGPVGQIEKRALDDPAPHPAGFPQKDGGR